MLPRVLTPVVTPYTATLDVDVERLIDQCRWLSSFDCGLAIFGTNSEGNSLSVSEKTEIIDRLVEAGIDPALMMPGTGACALPDAVALARHVARRNCGGALALPPFYYKTIADDGLFAFFSELIQRVGSSDLRLYLYHIPPVAEVGFSLDLIERLIDAYPQTLVGIKDSAAGFDNTRALCDRFPGWGVYAGNEMNLVEAMSIGARGCISATCNVNPAGVVDIAAHWDQDDAPARLVRANEIRKAFAAFPMIPAMKAAIARFRDDPAWAMVRPPLTPLPADAARALASTLDAIDFAMDFAAVRV